MSMQNDSTDEVVELLQQHLGAEYSDEELESPDTPAVRLSEAFEALSGMDAHFASSDPAHLTLVGARGLSAGMAQTLVYWRFIIRSWYWHSPSAILECDQCGEIRYVGSKKTKKCSRWACDGTLRAIDPPFATKRPRRRTVKVES